MSSKSVARSPNVVCAIISANAVLVLKTALIQDGLRGKGLVSLLISVKNESSRSK